MPAESPREPHTLPEPARGAEPDATPDGRASGTPPDPDRTSPHTAAGGTVPLDVVPVVPRDAAWPEVPGYEVTGEIARGGMGVVYAARDLTLGREVAVKTLLPQFAADPRFAGQFEREAGLTALLQHPGVPPVHGLGTLADGRPFLAMKLIRGRTLADELAAIDRVAGLPRLLGAFEQICQTVGYAHSLGVIHRDLKPANVMVGAFGEVQVMDWGLAKPLAGPEPTAGAGDVAGGADATRVGSAKGTPAYMPPEQARGEWDRVDRRADVFALGGILCVILTAQPLYTGASAAGVLRRAKAAELGHALAALEGCGADAELVALCRRCLSPDPADRPPHGKAVAEAVAAYRAGVEERARKAETERAAAEAEAREQRKRRKVQLWLAAAGVAIVGLLATGAVWSERANSRAENARGRAESLLELAGGLRLGYRFRDADNAIDQAGELAERFAPDLAGRVGRARADLALVRELDAIRMRRSTWVTEGAGRGHFDKAGAPGAYRRAFAGHELDVASDPNGVAERISASAVRASLVAALDDWAVLLPESDSRLREQVLAVVRRVEPESGANALREPEVWKDPARLKALAAQIDVGKLSPGAVVAVAEVMFERGLDPSRVLRHAVSLHPQDFLLVFTLGQVLKPDDPERLGAFRAARALRPDNIAVLTNLGHALHDRGDVEWAAAAHREAVRLEPGYAAGHTNLGSVLCDRGEFPAAVAEHREAVRLAPGYAFAHLNLSRALTQAGDPDGGLAAALEALRLDPRLAGGYLNLGVALRAKGDLCGAAFAEEEAIRLAPDFAAAYMNLGMTLWDARELDGAVAALRHAVRIRPGFAEAHSNLGLVLCDRGELDAAVAAHREALRLNPELAPARVNYGNTLRARKELAAAAAEFREAIRLDPGLPQAHTNLVETLGEMGDREGTAAAYREFLRLSPGDATRHYGVGCVLHARKDFAGAAAAFREAIRIKPDYAEAHNNLGLALMKAGDTKGAMAAFGDALRINPRLVQAHFNRGIILANRRELDGAIAAWKEAVRIHPEHAGAYANLGAALQEKGQLDEAILAHRAAIRLDPGSALPHCNLGHALQAKGDPVGAAAAFREAARLDPNDPLVHSGLGRALSAGNDLDGAAAAFGKAARLDPKDAESAYNAGSAYYQQRKYAEALPWAREAVRRGARFAHAHAMLGLCLQQTGDVAGARAVFEAARGLDPGRFGRLLAKLPTLPVAPPPRVKP
jgi:tetratricopeptide (TPR) repeat protein